MLESRQGLRNSPQLQGGETQGLIYIHDTVSLRFTLWAHVTMRTGFQKELIEGILKSQFQKANENAFVEARATTVKWPA